MTEIDTDRYADIKEALAEIAMTVAMARNGVEVAESRTSERSVRFAVISVRKHLDDVDQLIEEVEGLIAAALTEPEVETPRGAPGRDARTGRGGRGRRVE